MIKIGNYNLEYPLVLAPMEDVTDISFRKICKKLGADIVFTEFVNAEGLKRNHSKTQKKMLFDEDERPIIVQIYGENVNSMVTAAKIVEQLKPDMIDINAGCWVKKIANRGAGAGLLLCPDKLENMVKAVVDAVSIPVSVKTRIGWDLNSINILENAVKIQNAGAKLLSLHCRTRSQGHSGEPDWSWINKVKEVISIPVILNGGLMSIDDIIKAKITTNSDGLMIARGAIGQPWIFKIAKKYLNTGSYQDISLDERFDILFQHLDLAFQYKQEWGLVEFRKYYSGYLKGLFNSSQVRQQLMHLKDLNEIKQLLNTYFNDLKSHQKEN
ncbi:MAG TPA: tRNA dihydrouridine synthase DusB [Ignavibacteriales bacterium]|nr:tRNA dihydrouridine synthase DusB [Ignavibacteriales bacterium]HOL81840.1 tRNA dihydrouridine synthase DusB [Ignavibacteriales bacterium]HOM65059.1 tRNA dihydrouridine synthase DusB [Ignavibacteriales bacterium]HPD67209.1 tRNA dihydrouridine synthase DusB [Ignavibacteriales bacterium]HPP34023.1 tRNA dihydrouridine synthase DusB [Ignavibacteriales bacterium]